MKRCIIPSDGLHSDKPFRPRSLFALSKIPLVPHAWLDWIWICIWFLWSRRTKSK